MTSEEKAISCARIADSMKAADTVVSHVRDIIHITEYFVICTVTNRRQMKAVSMEIQRALKEDGAAPLSVEGEKEGTWVLLDCEDVVCHLFQPRERDYYALEMLWGDAPTVNWRE